MTCPSVRSCAIIPTYNLRDTQGNELRKPATFHTKESLLGGPQNNADTHRRPFCVLSPTHSFRLVAGPPKWFGGRTLSFPFLSPPPLGKEQRYEMVNGILLCGNVLAGLFSTIGAILDFLGKFVIGGGPGLFVALGSGLISLCVFSTFLGRTKVWESMDLLLCASVLFALGGLCVGTLYAYQANTISEWFAAVVLWGLLGGCLYPLGEFIYTLFDELF